MLAAQGDSTAAAEALRDGLDALAGTDLSYLRMVLHLTLARVLQETDRAAAEHEARLASTLLEQLDVTLSTRRRRPARPAVLGSPARPERPSPASRCSCRTVPGGRPGAATPRFASATRRACATWPSSSPIPASSATPSTSSTSSRAWRTDGPDRHALGDAGEVVDASARTAYRRRIEDLRNGVEDALDAEDDDRAARLQTELDELVAELARSFGLGGRDRRASSTAEKARLNVTRALRAALARLIEALPEAGAALDRRIRTGTFCAYEPQVDDIVRWDVQRAVNGTAVP